MVTTPNYQGLKPTKYVFLLHATCPGQVVKRHLFVRVIQGSRPVGLHLHLYFTRNVAGIRLCGSILHWQLKVTSVLFNYRTTPHFKGAGNYKLSRFRRKRMRVFGEQHNAPAIMCPTGQPMFPVLSMPRSAYTHSSCKGELLPNH